MASSLPESPAAAPAAPAPAAPAAEDRHIPVLCRETMDMLAPLFAGEGGKRPVRILDGTLGLGGHSFAMLSTWPNCQVLGLDRDTEALDLARTRLAPFGDRLVTRHSRFAEAARVLDELGWDGLDGALIDIGVSSMQLDESDRGFSVHGEGPLDMRMDQTAVSMTARELVNRADFKRLRDIIATYGEDPQAGRIARAICTARDRAPITTTTELARIVQDAYPPAWRAKARHHPATRTFQALRMVVNDELGELETFLESILARLRVGGRLCVITFHSLEDRLVKQTMRRWSQGCLCPPHVPVCRCHHVPEVRLLCKKPVTATDGELARNPRASSAKLRACEKIASWSGDAACGAQDLR